MLLIHETIKLACSIAGVCLYICVYIVHVFSFIGICPFKRSKNFYNHQHLMKIFWNHYHLSVSIFLSCLKAQRRKNLSFFHLEKRKKYIHTDIYIYTGAHIYTYTCTYSHIYIRSFNTAYS